MLIEKIEQIDKYLDSLLTLSSKWEQENSCYGYRANTIEDIKKEDVFVAQEDGDVIAYLLCHTYLQEKVSCTVPQNSRCLEIEELYVVPERRSNGIGRQLFDKAILNYGEEIDYVTLSTATKKYTAILHFYIEELGMTFWSARLFKKLSD